MGKDENYLRRCKQTKICSRIYIFGDFPAKEDNTPHALFTMKSSFHYRAIMGALLPSSWDCDENSEGAVTAGGMLDVWQQCRTVIMGHTRA